MISSLSLRYRQVYNRAFRQTCDPLLVKIRLISPQCFYNLSDIFLDLSSIAKFTYRSANDLCWGLLHTFGSHSSLPSTYQQGILMNKMQGIYKRIHIVSFLVKKKLHRVVREWPILI